MARCLSLEADGFDYLSILHTLMRGLGRARVCHVVASPRHSQEQLTIAPVYRARGVKRFKAQNGRRIRAAQRGTTLSKLWQLYATGPAVGDKVVQIMMNDAFVDRRLYRWFGGAIVISGFKLRHPRYPAFPVTHASQPRRPRSLRRVTPWERARCPDRPYSNSVATRDDATKFGAIGSAASKRRHPVECCERFVQARYG